MTVVFRVFFRFSKPVAAMGLVCLALLAVAACTDNIWRGQVATVNGESITLDQVRALRNSTHFGLTSLPLDDLEIMRKEYGDALTSLVAVALVKQQLAKKKMTVTQDDVLAEESLIRADYPTGTFEEILVGEGIDLETWRFLLHNHLSVQRFLDRILRPDIVITPEEADAYLKAHPGESVRPPWAYFFLVSGGDKDLVEACAKDLDKLGDPLLVQERHPKVFIRTVRLDTNRLAPALAGVVSKLHPGDLSPVLSMDGEFHVVLLLETLPQRQAEPDEVYLQIEEILVAQKIQAAYNEWITRRMQKSTIKVSSHLLPHLRRLEPSRQNGETALPPAKPVTEPATEPVLEKPS